MTGRSPRTSPTAVEGASLDLRGLLDAVAAAPPAEGVDALAGELAARVGANEVSMLIADISGATLTRLARRPLAGQITSGPCADKDVPVVGTPAGRALRSQRTQVTVVDGAVWVHAPVSERGDAIGVLEMALDDPPGQRVLDYLSAAGRALAFVVIADRRFSDLYELGQRSTPFSLEAEIQRRLLPAAYACEGPSFALAGWLIPADDAGGDTFDYVLEGPRLHLSITDAMGHGVAAAQLATLGVGSLRNSRRRGLDLAQQAHQANIDIAQNAGPDQFMTALLGQLDLHTGVLELVNAGHMNPLLVRAGRVEELTLDAGLVLGVVLDEVYDVQRVQLLPGDRLAFVTDGMSERDAADAEIERLLGTLGHLHPREAVQALTDAVLHVTGGSVRDDATVLVVDWSGTPPVSAGGTGPRPRAARAGGSRRPPAARTGRP